MQSRGYRFGNIGIRVESDIPYKEMERFAIFRDDETACDYVVSVKSGEIPLMPENLNRANGSVKSYVDYGNRKTWRFQEKEGELVPCAYTEENQEGAYQIYDKNLLDILGLRLIFEGFDFKGLVNRKNGILLHASYVLYKGKAILFCGPSGVGKSTQAELWEYHRGAIIVNGDRTLIQRCGENLRAHGICYAGTSGICKNISSDLAAIVVLEQDYENNCNCMTGLDALKALFPMCSFSKDNSSEMECLIDSLTYLINSVPVYLFKCTPDIRAIEELEKVL